MTNRTTDSSQGEGGHSPPAPGPPDHLHSRAGNKVFKSGPLFLSSKGIGWTSWKKRWFILTRTSLVFFRSDLDAQLDKEDGDEEMKQDLSFFANKNLPQNQQFDPGRNSKYEPILGRQAPTNLKKARGEGGTTSTSSALSKLTNRLNFLKERRSEIVSELQNLDKGRGSGPSAQAFERGQGSEYRQPVHGTIDGTIGFDSSHSHHNVDRGFVLQTSDKGRLEGQSAPNLERGKSESFPNTDKGRRSESHPLVPPRTYSR